MSFGRLLGMLLMMVPMVGAGAPPLMIGGSEQSPEIEDDLEDVTYGPVTPPEGETGHLDVWKAWANESRDSALVQWTILVRDLEQGGNERALYTCDCRTSFQTRVDGRVTGDFVVRLVRGQETENPDPEAASMETRSFWEYHPADAGFEGILAIEHEFQISEAAPGRMEWTVERSALRHYADEFGGPETSLSCMDWPTYADALFRVDTAQGNVHVNISERQSSSDIEDRDPYDFEESDSPGPEGQASSPSAGQRTPLPSFSTLIVALLIAVPLAAWRRSSV